MHVRDGDHAIWDLVPRQICGAMSLRALIRRPTMMLFHGLEFCSERLSAENPHSAFDEFGQRDLTDARLSLNEKSRERQSADIPSGVRHRGSLASDGSPFD